MRDVSVMESALGAYTVHEAAVDLSRLAAHLPVASWRISLADAARRERQKDEEAAHAFCPAEGLLVPAVEGSAPEEDQGRGAQEQRHEPRHFPERARNTGQIQRIALIGDNQVPFAPPPLCVELLQYIANRCLMVPWTGSFI